jgi:hypothetical protein
LAQLYVGLPSAGHSAQHFYDNAFTINC